MIATEAPPVPRRTVPIELEPLNYLNERHSIGSWLLTTDHKRIGLLYLFSIIIFFAIAGVAAALMRLELITPQGDLVLSETYNKLFTLHGVLMVWFFLIPSIPAVLGNFVIPMMLGARDVAFPKLNLLSWYLFMAGGVLRAFFSFFWRVGTPGGLFLPRQPALSRTHRVATWG